MTASPHTQSQPGTESLPERLRLNSCRRCHETAVDSAARRFATELEAADHIEELTRALTSAQRIIDRDFPTGQLAIVIRRALATSLEGRGGAT